MTSVLLAMIAGALLIRWNGALATLLGAAEQRETSELQTLPVDQGQRVVIGGYGRVGHTIAVLLQSAGIPFVAFDTDPARVSQGRREGHPVSYGDISDPGLLAAIQVERAALVVITVDQQLKALRAISLLRKNCPQVPVIARARDPLTSANFLQAGATHAYPEAIEASLRLGETAMKMLHVPDIEIDEAVQSLRDWGYHPIMDKKEEQNQ